LYQKFTATYVFDGTALLPKDSVIITNKEGVIHDIVSIAAAGDDVMKYDGIICPGFINTHCHLELSHLKNKIPPHTGLVDFVFSIITKRDTTAAQIQEAIVAAENEMLQNGIVAVGDICNTANTATQKVKRQLRYHNFIEVTGFVPGTAAVRLTAVQEIAKAFEHVGLNSIVPHAPYSVSPQLFQLINTLPGNNLLTIHNQETAAENIFFREGTGDFLRLYQQLGIDISFYQPTGNTSLQSFLPYVNNGQSLLLVHNVDTTEQDIAVAKQMIATQKLASVFICLCPNANLYISNILPDIELLLQQCDDIVLGTDSLASNMQLSILAEMKTIQRHYPDLPATQLLRWATSNGARALQMDDKLGSLKKGKQPGIVLIKNVANMQLTANSIAERLL
jgi:aminodeoxyfutalosine deaminase